MADCVCLPGCPFFNDKMAGKPSTSELMKKQYCRGDFASCARFIVFEHLGREKVPSDLFPNQNDQAKQILAAG